MTAIRFSPQNEEKSDKRFSIGGDDWKQKHYAQNLECMLAALQGREGSVSSRSNSWSRDSGAGSSAGSGLSSLSLEDVAVDFYSQSSGSESGFGGSGSGSFSDDVSMPDNLSIGSDSVFGDEPVWDLLTKATRENSPANKRERKLQASAKRILSNLSDEREGGVEPEVNPRKRYKKMLSELREMRASLQKGPQSSSKVCQACSNLVKSVSRSLFLAPRSNHFYTALVQATKEASGVQFPEVRGCSGEQLAQRLKATQEAVRTQKPALEDASGAGGHLINVGGGLAAGEMGVNYDPYLQGNQPYPLFSFDAGGREATCIRMGTPTRQAVFGAEEVTPEFCAFLEGLPQGAQHLYINRQKRSGVEGGRSKTLEQFQDSPESSDRLTVVTFPADGELYEQKGPYSGDCTFSDMDGQLVDAMVSNSNGFYFPEKFRKGLGGEERFKAFLHNAMERIATELEVVQGKPMDVSLRRACIFHLLNKTLPELMLKELKAETYNNTCKDDIDRGGMANAYMYLCKTAPASVQDSKMLEAWMQDVEGVVFAPAITVKKREVIQHRFDDLANALERLPFWNKGEVTRL